MARYVQGNLKFISTFFFLLADDDDDRKSEEDFSRAVIVNGREPQMSPQRAAKILDREIYKVKFIRPV